MLIFVEKQRIRYENMNKIIHIKIYFGRRIRRIYSFIIIKKEKMHDDRVDLEKEY